MIKILEIIEFMLWKKYFIEIFIKIIYHLNFVFILFKNSTNYVANFNFKGFIFIFLTLFKLWCALNTCED